MLNLYTSVILITLLLLSITAADIISNRLITKETKKLSIIVCILIGSATLGECVGFLTNGASASWIPLHTFAKLIEFCATPMIGIIIAVAYGAVRKPKIALIVSAVHAVVECISLKFGWIFRVDSENIYNREKFYWIYVLAFTGSLIYGLVSIIRNDQKYHTQTDSALILTFILLITGIIIQFIDSDIRIDFLCVTIANLILYNRYCKMILQIDALTHLLNRRCYETSIGSLNSDALLMFFDVNKFKLVNDTYGHSAGDICLQRISAQLQNVYGKYGNCYRIGGDEFCVILNKNFDSVESLNNNFKSAIFKEKEKDKRIPDVAIGYAFFDVKNSHIQTVIEKADAMMYKNKHAAENTVTPISGSQKQAAWTMHLDSAGL